MSLLAANAVRPDRAVIVVTHDARVFHYAHSIAHMDDGRIVNTTRRDEALHREADHVVAGASMETYA
jgi:ABC-type lipoprotein export system ATPase subunit